MSDTNLKLPTKCAHWGRDDHRYFGFSVFEELAGHESMTGLTALSVLGRRLPKECCDILDDIACIATLADPRIWPLKVTRLVASYGSVMPAVAAGEAMLQGALVSPWMATDAALTLQELYTEVSGRCSEMPLVRQALNACFQRRAVVSGFGMPCRNADERLVALGTCVRRRNRDRLPYWRLLSAIIEVVRPLRRLPPNIGLGIAAAMLDMGISSEEIGPLTSALFQHMFVANAIEGTQASQSQLRQLSSAHVCYSGTPPRMSSRAQVHNSIIRPEAGTEPMRTSPEQAAECAAVETGGQTCG